MAYGGDGWSAAELKQEFEEVYNETVKLLKSVGADEKVLHGLSLSLNVLKEAEERMHRK